MRQAQYSSSGPPGFPPLPSWLKQLLGALLGLYVLELLLLIVGAPLGTLMWWPFGFGFAPWQLATHLLIVSPDNVIGVFFGLLSLYFFLPPVLDTLGRRKTQEGIVASLVGATAVVLLVDGVVSASGLPRVPVPVGGWIGPVPMALLVLFASAQPNSTLLAFFVVPIRATWLLWAGPVFASLSVLTSMAQGGTGRIGWWLLGSWIGAYAWWNLRGPGRRRRDLKKKGRAIERELRRFEVLPGGRDTIH